MWLMALILSAVVALLGILRWWHLRQREKTEPQNLRRRAERAWKK